jgi:hypothetical protein
MRGRLRYGALLVLALLVPLLGATRDLADGTGSGTVAERSRSVDSPLAVPGRTARDHQVHREDGGSTGRLSWVTSLQVLLLAASGVLTGGWSTAVDRSEARRRRRPLLRRSLGRAPPRLVLA